MRALLFLLSCLSAGCVQLRWDKVNRYAPIEPEALQSLEPGRSRLEDCLGRLGAPVVVLETENGDGAVLMYVWQTEDNRGFGVSVPVGDYGSADFDYDQLQTRGSGATLFFDSDWTLSEVREGPLLDLAADLERRRPAFVDLDENG